MSKITPNSVQSRLEQWGQWVQERRHIEPASSSPFARIREMRENAGIADGIRYEIIDGVACPPDGGMAREVERRARAWAYDIRCRETHTAIADLPDGMRRAVIAVYVVPQREGPRTIRAAAHEAGIPKSTFAELLGAAHTLLSRAIYGPFSLSP